MNGDLGRWIAVPLKAFNDAVEACTRSKTKRFPATALAGSTFSNGVEKLILGSIIPMTPPITVSTQNAASVFTTTLDGRRLRGMLNTYRKSSPAAM